MNAIHIEPAPKHASAMATALLGRANPSRTITTVLTMTIALPAAAAKVSANNPRNRDLVGQFLHRRLF